MKLINYIIELGKNNLRDIIISDNKQNANITYWENFLSEYSANRDYRDEDYAWLSCVFALKAVYCGNFGVGSILVDSNGEIVSFGHNEVFYPYFRSDRHAEMVVMNDFEDKHKNVSNVSGYTLYTSLESCPMCLTRLIASGIKKIYHVGADETGGMTNRMKESMPEAWLELSRGQDFDQAVCSPALSNAATEIFLLTAYQLYAKLMSRRV